MSVLNKKLVPPPIPHRQEVTNLPRGFWQGLIEVTLEGVIGLLGRKGEALSNVKDCGIFSRNIEKFHLGRCQG